VNESTGTTTTTEAPALLGATLGIDIAAAVEVYEATERTAREVYEATERPAREVYEATERTAREAYEATRRPAREAYEATERTAREVYEATERPAREVYEATERTAREGLLQAVSADPLAAWIIEYAMPDHHDEALIVLRALPATIETLDELADDHRWCRRWFDLRTAAEVAGALTTTTERSCTPP
jgi:hypothetical protein